MKVEMSPFLIKAAEEYRTKHGVYPPWYEASAIPGKKPAAVTVATTKTERTDEWEQKLLADLMQLRLEGLPLPECQYHWHPTRKFRSDFAYPDLHVLIEVQGGIYKVSHDPNAKSRHTSGAGYESDRARSNLAQIEGWMILEYGPEAIRKGEAAKEIRAVLLSKLGRTK